MMTLVLERMFPDGPGLTQWYRVIDERSREIYGEGETPFHALGATARASENERRDRFHRQFNKPDSLDRSDALLQATRIVEEVIADLDETVNICNHCERPTFRNWTERNTAGQLRAVAEKLRRFAASHGDADRTPAKGGR